MIAHRAMNSSKTIPKVCSKSYRN